MTTQRIYYSRLKLGGMTFALAAILIAPGVMSVLKDRDDAPFGTIYLPVVSTVLFLLAAWVVVKFYRVCVDHKPVVTITDQGITDRRISKEMIIWSDIASAQFSGGRDRTIHLRLTPGARKRLRMRLPARIYNAFLGVVGIATGPLAVRDSALLRAIEMQIARSRAEARVEGATSPPDAA